MVHARCSIVSVIHWTLTQPHKSLCMSIHMGNQLLVSSKGLLTPGKLTHSWCKAQLEMVTDPCGGRAKSCLAMAFKRESGLTVCYQLPWTWKLLKTYWCNPCSIIVCGNDDGLELLLNAVAWQSALDVGDLKVWQSLGLSSTHHHLETIGCGRAQQCWNKTKWWY